MSTNPMPLAEALAWVEGQTASLREYAERGGALSEVEQRHIAAFSTLCEAVRRMEAAEAQVRELEAAPSFRVVSVEWGDSVTRIEVEGLVPEVGAGDTVRYHRPTKTEARPDA